MFESYLHQVFASTAYDPDRLIFLAGFDAHRTDANHIQNLESYYTKSNEVFKLTKGTTNNILILAKNTGLKLDFSLQKDTKLKLVLHNYSSDINLNISLDGVGSQLELQLVNIFEVNKKCELGICINHLADNVETNTSIKNISAADSQTILNAQLAIAPKLKKIQSDLKIKTLKISSTSKFTANPDLKILSQDVQCSHSNTISSFETSMFQYLQSRGLTVDEAQNIYIQGFLDQNFA
jgi:hypothetical protein